MGKTTKDSKQLINQTGAGTRCKNLFPKSVQTLQLKRIEITKSILKLCKIKYKKTQWIKTILAKQRNQLDKVIIRV